MEDNRILKLVYTFFLGLLLAIFIGVGINTFYAPPEPPKYPVELNTTYGKEMSEKQIAMEKDYGQKMETFDNTKMEPYNRNVSIMTLSAAVLLLAVSLMLEKKKVEVISDGVMLGGLFTLLYSLGRGFASQDSKYSFISITVGLMVVLYLGYHRFVKTKKPSK
ncbi:hypothetical protein [Mucilaginibacter sp.]|jgi:hypothetical protein|uniref:hypothetical protein n=1 Tax=Mucilaginibacter sp. TaxID=1882438 RepID=UPI003566D877